MKNNDSDVVSLLLNQIQSDIRKIQRDIENISNFTSSSTSLTNLSRHTCEFIHDENTESWRCNLCKKSGGWWCPDGPDHKCHYWHSEMCTFCGQPEERK